MTTIAPMAKHQCRPTPMSVPREYIGGPADGVAVAPEHRDTDLLVVRAWGNPYGRHRYRRCGRCGHHYWLDRVPDEAFPDAPVVDPRGTPVGGVA